MIDIHVSLIEFETSFKQVFMFQLLFKKIMDACKPVTQILEHIDAQSVKKHSQKNEKYAGSDGGENQGEERSPKSGILLSVHVSSIYLALIKETLSDSFLGGSMPYGHEMNCMPMLSLEVKWLELRQKTQITGLQ
jgi:hypothetical protein